MPARATSTACSQGRCGSRSRCRPRSLGWASGQLSPSCSFLRRRRIDRRHRTRAPTRPLQAASQASLGPLPFKDRLASITLVTFPGAVPGSPSIHVTPATMVRRMAPIRGSIQWIFRSRYCPTRSAPSARASPESSPPGAGIVGEHTAGLRIDLLDAILGELKQMLAVKGPSLHALRLRSRALSSRSQDWGRSACLRTHTRRAERRTSPHVHGPQPGKGPH